MSSSIEDKQFLQAHIDGCKWSIQSDFLKEGSSHLDIVLLMYRITQAIDRSGCTLEDQRVGWQCLRDCVYANSFSGDPLRGLMELFPVVCSILAGTRGLCCTIGQLRKYGADGQITNETLLKAFGVVTHEERRDLDGYYEDVLAGKDVPYDQSKAHVTDLCEGDRPLGVCYWHSLHKQGSKGHPDYDFCIGGECKTGVHQGELVCSAEAAPQLRKMIDEEIETLARRWALQDQDWNDRFNQMQENIRKMVDTPVKLTYFLRAPYWVYALAISVGLIVSAIAILCHNSPIP